MDVPIGELAAISEALAPSRPLSATTPDVDIVAIDVPPTPPREVLDAVAAAAERAKQLALENRDCTSRWTSTRTG